MSVLLRRVVSPWMRWTSPANVAALSLWRTCRLDELILIGLSRFWENPCSALGGPLGAAWAAGGGDGWAAGGAAWTSDAADIATATTIPAANGFMASASPASRCFAFLG